ncbi:MAG: hypothetical protein VYD71_03425 [Bacteroidota bacterium]|nr:hypothetical protein [Bacteroidota bacterium]
MKNKIVLIGMSLICSTVVQSQDIQTTEVRVTEEFNPSIPEASKLNEQASFADTLKEDKSQTYSIKQYHIKADYKTRPLKAAKVKDESILKLYKSKVSLGLGDNWNKDISLLHNSKRSQDFNFGLLMHHLSNQYKPTNYQVKNSKNTLYLYGKKIGASHIYLANFDYDRITASYFNTSSSFEEKYFRNRFAYSKISVSAISRSNVTDRLIKKVNFFLSDLNEMSENQIHLSADLANKIAGYPIDIEVELNDYLNYNNKDSKYDPEEMKELHFVPQTNFDRFGMNFHAGFNLHYDRDGVAISPIINATKEFVKNILWVHGGIRHTEQRNTLKSLGDENPYIHSFGTNQSILTDNTLLQTLTTTSKDELYLTMRNVLGKDEVFEGTIAYAKVKNFANFFAVDNNEYNRFLIDYLDVSQMHISANYERILNNMLSVNVQANYFNWNKEVYYKPNLRVDVSTPINLRDKIKAVPSISYLGNRMTYSKNLLDSELGMTNELSGQLHANLMVQYIYTKILSAYLQFNNLTNSNEFLFEGYQEIGFNAVFGVNYSF